MKWTAVVTASHTHSLQFTIQKLPFSDNLQLTENDLQRLSFLAVTIQCATVEVMLITAKLKKGLVYQCADERDM